MQGCRSASSYSEIWAHFTASQLMVEFPTTNPKVQHFQTHEEDSSFHKVGLREGPFLCLWLVFIIVLKTSVIFVNLNAKETHEQNDIKV